MKREHVVSGVGASREYHDPMGRGKKMMMDKEMDAGMDELLAVLGYKVRYSDMADVAEKLEQLDRAFGSGGTQEGNLATDTVHYNPSDLSSWVENMMSEFNHQDESSSFLQSAISEPVVDLSSAAFVEFHSQDISRVRSDCSPHRLRAGSSCLQYGLEQQMESGPRDRKRMKISPSSSFSAACGGGMSPPSIGSMPAFAGAMEMSPAFPTLMAEDSQEAGICLVHALLACAEAIEQENYKSADAIMRQISVLTSSQRGAMQKVASYFGEALSRRIYSLHLNRDCSLDSAFSDILQMHFYESCPYLKFAHFTANQAILEAFAGFRRVHVIDFGIKQGMQWPALMQALALRPGGPPSFRLTGIGPPQPDNTDALQQVGWKLSQLAETLHIDFEFRGLLAKNLADIEPCMLDCGSAEPEAVAINSVFELHGLLAIPGTIEKVLDAVRTVRPRIMTVIEQDANHNSGSFVERFTEALHYYSTLFDSLESGEGQAEQVMTEVFLGRQICNVVACEGAERTERHETLAQWRALMSSAGFQPVHLGSNAFKQASLLLALFASGDGYRVEEREGCLTLGWHTRPLIATSAWQVADDSAPVSAAVVIPSL